MNETRAEGENVSEECFGKKSRNSIGNSSTVIFLLLSSLIFRFSGCTERDVCLFIYNYRTMCVLRAYFISQFFVLARRGWKFLSQDARLLTVPRPRPDNARSSH